MKKSCIVVPNVEIQLKKLLRIMKITTFLLFLGMISCFAGVKSQDATISLSMKNSTLLDLFNAIEENTEYKIFYKTSIIDEKQLITLSVDEKPVSDLLAMVLPSKNLTYDLVDKVIVITALSDKNQALKVSGIVKDASTGEPLPGVNIQIEGTNSGVVTDVNGKYSIEIPKPEAVLVFSYIGYMPETVPLDGKTVIDINLVPDITALEEVVVVGYGTQSKRTVTGSVASVASDKFADRSYANVSQSLAGLMPGVNITQSQGAPGSSPIIRIRGISSITAGTNPLYVIDGLPMENFNLNLINPSDIASVEVLKDASSAAIYGSRGANGVILITTKLGKPGKAVISATYEYGVQKVTRTVDMMDAQEWIEYYIDAHNNSWIDADPVNHSASDPNSARTSTYRIPVDFTTDPGQFGKGTDWQDVLFRPAPSHNFQLSVSGGSEKTQYMISGAYLDQEAVIDRNYYKRLSLRTNIKQVLSDRFTVGGNLGFTGIFDRTDGTLGKSDVVSLALQNDPIFPIYNENGNLGFKDPNSEWYRFASYGDVQLWHPYSMTREVDKQNKSFNSLGSAYLEAKIVDGLTFRTSVNGNLYNIRFDSYQNALRKYGYSNATEAEAAFSSSYMFNWLSENTLAYEKQFGDHSIKALIGYTAQKQRNEYEYSFYKGFANDLTHTGNAGTINQGNTSASEWSMLSYLGRINYSYKNRYFLTGTLRRDGSSRFGANNKWGYFPSVSAGWLVSDEAFMAGNGFINTLKLKASYGLTGNNQIPNYGPVSLLGASATLQSQSSYVFNNSITKGLLVTNVSNPDLRWEKTSQFNVGFEMDILDNRINLVAEYYSSVTKDLLLNVPIPDITGFATQLTNIGKLRNRGFEFNITTHNMVSDLKWTTDFNLSLNRNKVLALGQGDAPFNFTEWNATVRVEKDEPISNYYGYKFDGVFSAETLATLPHDPDAKPGDPIVRDANTDGSITAADKVILGNAQPDFITALTNTLTYKGVEFAFMFQGSFGGEIANQQTRYSAFWNGGRNAYKEVYKYWRSEAEPGDGKHYRPELTHSAYQSEFSSYWIEDKTFIRLKNIRLGYTLPRSISSKLGMASTKIYINVENAFLWSKYVGYDPENSIYNSTQYSASGATTSASSLDGGYNATTSTAALPTGLMLGVDFGSYPIPRVITMGIKVEF